MNVLHKLKMKLKKPKEVEKLEINVDKCVGCGNCVKMCNFGAINLVLAKTS